MKSAKTLLIGLLALTTIGGAVLAWRQHQELLDARAAALNREERADFQKKIWDLQKANQALEARLAAQRRTAGEPGDGPREVRPRGDRPPLDGPDGRLAGTEILAAGSALRDLMNKPEYQALQAAQRRQRIEQTYAALFRTLNLSPEQAQKLTALLAERQNTRQDVVEAARSQGLNPRENPEMFQKLMENARNELNTSIRGVIGESGLAQLQTFDQTLPQRNLVAELQQRLAYSGNNLSIEQENQLVQILAANQGTQPTRVTAARGIASVPDLAPAGARAPDMGGMIGALLGGGTGEIESLLRVAGGGVPITSQAVTQAQGFLTQPQVTALQQMQQQQQAQQRMQQIVVETLASQRGARPAPPSGGAPAAPARKGDGK